MKVVAFMRSPSGLTLYDEAGRSKNIPADAYNIAKIVEALDLLIRTGEPVTVDYEKYAIEKALAVVAPAATIEKDEASVTIRFDDLGLKIRDMARLNTFLLAASRSERDAVAMRAFLANVALAKRDHSVDDLLAFMQAHDLPLTDDGCVLAWKYVKALDAPRQEDGATHVDQRTGTMDNSPGKLVFMDVAGVNPDRTIDCSTGLHVCSEKYLQNFWATKNILLVKVHPAHFIAVPITYSHQKARTCAHLNIALVSPKDKAKAVERYRDLPVIAHIDGKRIEIATTIPTAHADLVSHMGRINQVAATAPTEKPGLKRPGVKKPAAPPRQSGYHAIDELAETTARTVASLRSLAARRGWPKRLSKTGKIEIKPDRAFVAAELTGWIPAADLARQRHRTRREIATLARRNGWSTRRTKAGLEIKIDE